MKIKINFFRKLLIFSTGIIFATVSIGYILNIFFVDDFYIYRKKEYIKEIKIRVDKLQNDPEELEDYIDTLKEVDGIEVKILKNKNHKMMGHSKYQEIDNKKWKNQTFKISTIPKIGVKLLTYNAPLKNGKYIFVRTSLSVMNAHKHEIYLFNIITTIISILVALILGRIFSKKLTRNIEKLNKKALEISQMKFSNDIIINSGDEIEELSKSLNSMSKNLNSSINNLKSFVSNASHELKTPVAVLSTHIQALKNNKILDENKRKKYLDILMRETSEMNDLINNLLTISRISSPDYKIKLEKINLKNLIEDSLEKYEILELEKDIEIIKVYRELSILGDEKLLKLAINNIIQNALKYGKEESQFLIYDKDDYLYFENEFQGKLSEEQLEELYVAFARGENALNEKIEGNGLGLSIIKSSLELCKIDYGIFIKNNKFIFKIKLN
ncbi:MAG: histidine kinase dimerization/phospho-acceptor domain-containing protein [Cetobacterium sp.]